MCSKMCESVAAHTILNESTVTNGASMQGVHRPICEQDRSFNVILFGIKEDKDANKWHQAVNDVLKVVATREIDMVDLFRIGRYNVEKVRPIIVKLRTIWDKRILLSNSY